MPKENLRLICNHKHAKNDFVSLTIQPDDNPLAERVGFDLIILMDFVPRHLGCGKVGLEHTLVEGYLAGCKVEASIVGKRINGQVSISIKEKTRSGIKVNNKIVAEVGASDEKLNAKLGGELGTAENSEVTNEYDINTWTAKMFGSGYNPEFHFKNAIGCTFIEEQYQSSMRIVPDDNYNKANGFFCSNCEKHLIFTDLNEKKVSAPKSLVLKFLARKHRKQSISVGFNLVEQDNNKVNTDGTF